MKKILCILLLSGVITANAASCDATLSDYEKSACVASNLFNASAALGEVFPNVLQTLRGSEKQKLIEAQRLWTQFQKADCLAYSALNQESGAGLAEWVCLTEHVQIRTKQLLKYTTCNM